jgi:putative heme-binding domain-containing protein
MYYRASSLGNSRMPRVGSREVDRAFVDALAQWIETMPAGTAKPARAGFAEALERLGPRSNADLIARTSAIKTLTASATGAMVLARALDQGVVSPEARAQVLAATRDHSAAEVRDLFERFLPQSARVVRLGEVIEPSEILRLPGDARRGRDVFTAESVVNCKSCHLLDGVGIAIGPDLSKIGAKYPKPDLLREILQPSRTIDPKFAVHVVATRDGLIKSGLLVERDAKTIVLRDAQNQRIEIPADAVESVAPQAQSLMPEFLLRGLTPGQAADLLEYLSTLR